jgi:sugar O-acyltransferase (sialic acid O-acetyltransferase NeuD family)
MKWAIVGAGAQGRVILDILRADAEDDEFVFVDDNRDLRGRRVCEVEVVGREWLTGRDGPGEVLAIVAIGHNEVRLRVAAELVAKGVRFGNAVHPSAAVMPSAMLGEGVMVGPGAVIGTSARIADHTVINTGALIEHDCVVAEGASVSPGVSMAGRLTIGPGAFVGTGAVLNPRITIGAKAIVGSGSLVTRDIAPGMLVYGAPAREIRPVDANRDWPRLF